MQIIQTNVRVGIDYLIVTIPKVSDIIDISMISHIIIVNEKPDNPESQSHFLISNQRLITNKFIISIIYI